MPHEANTLALRPESLGFDRWLICLRLRLQSTTVNVPEFSGFMDGQSGALLRIGAVSSCWFYENKICRYQTVIFNKDGLSDLTNILLFLLLVGGLVSSLLSGGRGQVR